MCIWSVRVPAYVAYIKGVTEESSLKVGWRMVGRQEDKQKNRQATDRLVLVCVFANCNGRVQTSAEDKESGNSKLLL
jgi:hypothetical protein